MTKLLLKFMIKFGDMSDHHGPLFHKWIPNGFKDAIELKTNDDDVKLKIWFERRGYVHTSFFHKNSEESEQHDSIQYDFQKREVDPKIMSKQSNLVGGPLFGILELHNISKGDLKSIIEDKKGDKEYIDLGKKIVKKYIYPPVNAFLDILRINFGQYWLNFINWDSRKESLSSYCSSIDLKWSVDGGKNWKPFLPDKNISKSIKLFWRVVEEEQIGNITQNDWKNLENVINKGYKPSEGSFVLSNAYKALNNNNLKYALIEAVISLEIAVSEYIHAKMNDIEFNPFDGIPLRKQITILMLISGKFSPKEMNHVNKMIELRNKIIHEGWDSFTFTYRYEILDFIEIISRLFKGPKFKFPD